ncbi:MAG: TraR/DksA C4-type zinc finger protein [Halanaerobacter sp.]
MKSLEYYRQRLMEERSSLLEEVESLEERDFEGLTLSFKERTGELSNYDNHPADGGSDTFDRSKDLGLKDNDLAMLEMIDDALKKIEAGDYGFCDSCQQEIDPQRLEAVPYSTFCYQCKEEVERIDDQSRPLEEDLLGELQGRSQMNLDNKSSVIYDGEDSWQEVAKYGSSNTPSDILGAESDDDSYLNADEEIGSIDWSEQIIDQQAEDFVEQVMEEASTPAGEDRKEDGE